MVIAKKGSPRQTLTVTNAAALHGTVTINIDGTLSYSPDADYNGPDTISYTITDDGTTNGAPDPLTASSTSSAQARARARGEGGRSTRLLVRVSARSA